MQRYHAEHAFVDGAWQGDVGIDVDAGGYIAAVQAGVPAEGRERIRGWVLPGLPNLHSHAFQRAMAGLAERASDPADSFWTWREQMYRCAAWLTPDRLRIVASQLYLEMLEAGYTHVCEFHYLHHAPDGRPYAPLESMLDALREAAAEVGIGLTLLPVLYQTGGLDGRPLAERQRRFGSDLDTYLRLLEAASRPLHPHQRAGVCFHSLRAVPEPSMRQVLAAAAEELPVHIHVAEQEAEVEDCLRLRGRRPVRWLLDEIGIGPRWCLVHATHVDAGECAALAASGAVVGLCPTTEANLGDGLFPLRAYLDAGGRWGIGSDSHVCVSPVEELRWLEYGQRLWHRRRNVVAAEGRGCGEVLLQGALAGGAQASGVRVGRIAPPDARGAWRADWIVLDPEADALAGARAEDVLDRWIFAAARPIVDAVMSAGVWQVRQGRHRLREAVSARFTRLMSDFAARAVAGQAD